MEGALNMEATIMNVEVFPLPIRERIHTAKVSVQENDGRIVLIPIEESLPQRKLGGLEGKVFMSDDFNAPMEEFED